jgi:hypothetical protein
MADTAEVHGGCDDRVAGPREVPAADSDGPGRAGPRVVHGAPG